MKKTDLAALEVSVSRSFWLVTGLVIAILTAYCLWFYVAQSKDLSNDPGSWGEFGDFVGGLLNPIVAYSAFYWLTRSVLLQKEELLETRVALEQSAEAQVRSAAAAERSARIAACTALLNSAVSELQSLQQQANSLVDQSSRHTAGSARLSNGRWATIDEVTSELGKLERSITHHTHMRLIYENDLSAMVSRGSQNAA